MIEFNIVVLSYFSQSVILAFIVARMVAAVFAAYAYKLVTATLGTLMFNWYSYTTLIIKSLTRL